MCAIALVSLSDTVSSWFLLWTWWSLWWDSVRFLFEFELEEFFWRPPRCFVFIEYQHKSVFRCWKEPPSVLCETVMHVYSMGESEKKGFSPSTPMCCSAGILKIIYGFFFSLRVLGVVKWSECGLMQHVGKGSSPVLLNSIFSSKLLAISLRMFVVLVGAEF